MESLSLVLLLLAGLASSNALFCRSAGDCDEDECCAVITKAMLSRFGLCLKLSMEGGRCLPSDEADDEHGGKFVRYCPCQKSLECVAMDNMDDNNFPDAIKTCRHIEEPVIDPEGTTAETTTEDLGIDPTEPTDDDNDDDVGIDPTEP